jgi:predicted ATPase
MCIQQGFRRVVFTGGPGAGKTALLTELERRGYRVVPEVARAIISERKQKGLPPRP